MIIVVYSHKDIEEIRIVSNSISNHVTLINFRFDRVIGLNVQREEVREMLVVIDSGITYECNGDDNEEPLAWIVTAYPL